MRVRLTDRFVQAIKPNTQQTDYWDKTLTGFGLRVSPQGRKTFQILYRFHRIQRRFALGPYPPLTLAEARKYARQTLADVHKGADPAAVRHVNRDAETFARLADDYIVMRAKRLKRSWREDQRILRRDIIPAWRARKAKDITRRDIQELIQRIAERAPIMANRSLSVLRQVFNFAVDQGWLEFSPCQRIGKPSVERQRQRVLDTDEIKKLWGALEARSSRVSDALRLQLLTAQRIGEVRRMRVEDVDLKHRWWTIPPEFSKNGLAHRVPLSTEAIEIVSPRIDEAKGKWVFSSSTDKSRPLGYAIIHHDVRRFSLASGVTDWTTHDLRRTAASHLAGMGVSRLVLKKLLNHRDTEITGVYDRYEYENEKRAALDPWGRRIRSIAQGTEENTKVVSFAPVRK